MGASVSCKCYVIIAGLRNCFQINVEDPCHPDPNLMAVSLVHLSCKLYRCPTFQCCCFRRLLGQKQNERARIKDLGNGTKPSQKRKNVETQNSALVPHTT
ncbi:Uncharacterized protein TCM_034469 [Theobroma cacao]|uniref:Uncharacterized protein n=1 Tax=Theobroma cacao TaxID=3641 RepID=A0A061FLK7_THECC|nr:Uncharacterized protein TCM_034469 [Theobroma cacao]